MRPEDPQGPVPGSWDDAREAFLSYVEEGINPVDFLHWGEASERYAVWLFEHLVLSSEAMPDPHCEKLGLPPGSSYGHAARALLKSEW